MATHLPVAYPTPGISLVKDRYKISALNRLKTVRGHLDAVIAMVEDDRYCPEVVKQVSALQASLERVNRASVSVVANILQLRRFTPGHKLGAWERS
jgi:DNA-binding FrmR family transcriptional regulator